MPSWRRSLRRAGPLHARAHRRTRLTRGRREEFGLAWRRNLELEIDAIEQRPGQAPAVAPDLVRRAMTAAVQVAEETAGAGIHRRHQLEARRKRGAARSARNGDLPGFERLAQRFQHAAIEFRQLVEKQHAAMRKGNLPGPRRIAATHQRRCRSRMVRRAVRPHAPALRPEAARSGVDRRDFERIVLGQRGQQRRQPRREHRFSGAGWTEHQHAVTARGGNLQRAFRVHLAAYFREIHGSRCTGAGGAHARNGASGVSPLR